MHLLRNLCENAASLTKVEYEYSASITKDSDQYLSDASVLLFIFWENFYSVQRLFKEEHLDSM